MACNASKTPKTVKKLEIGKIELVIHALIGGIPYHPDSTYFFPNGQPYQLTKIQFYTSHLALANAVGKEEPAIGSSTSGVFFVPLTAKSNPIELNVAVGEYSDLRFDIGLPRDLNHSDPSLAKAPLGLENSEMFWEWNSGYIFFLAEGKSKSLPGERFHFAIGGDAQIMPISFGNLFDLIPLIKVKSNKTTKIELTFDFAEILKNSDGSTYPIDSKGAFMVHNGPKAEILRNNILRAFKFQSSKVVD